MNDTTSPLIIRLDASSLKSSSCLRKLYWLVVGGYRVKGAEIELHYGTCFHHYAELVAKGVPPHEAVAQTREMFMATVCREKYGKGYLDAVHLSLTCALYTKACEDVGSQFNSAELLTSPVDGSPLVECKFSLPIYKDSNVEVLLQGTIDRIAKIKNGGCIVIEDFKTTSAKSPEDYFKPIRMNPQMMTYSFAIRQLAAAYPDGLFGKLLAGNSTIGCRIKGVFLDPKIASKFIASDVVYYSVAELDAYYEWLMGLCKRLVFHVMSGIEPPPEGTFNDTCRSSFGSYCPYFDVCRNATQLKSEGMKAMLQAHFTQTEYTPLNFGGGHGQKAVGKSLV